MEQNFNNIVNDFLKPLDNYWVRTILLAVLTLYGAGIVQQSGFEKVYSNPIVRVVSMFLLVWLGNKDPAMALVVAMAFISSLTILSSPTLSEKFEGPLNSIYPGCLNIKVTDLLESFNNDKDALIYAMLFSRVPGDIKLNDYYAPLIGTYLLSKGYLLKSPCTPPTVDDVMDRTF
jgi:hypothetical protein